MLEIRTWQFYGCELVNLIDLMNLKGLSLNQLGLLGESASPFIDEGDGLTGERERVRMLLSLSLVAHADGCRIMVGAHNTVDVTIECQMHVGGYVVFFGYGRCRYLPYC